MRPSLARQAALLLIVLAGAAPSLPALAQGIPPNVPDMSSRIPKPLPPPPGPPEIYGPGRPYQPQVYQPPHLNTHSDRASRCLHQGSVGGLHGGRLQAYARACANDN